MFWTIPTLMTWTRIVAIPLIVGVFYAPLEPATRNLIATVMFIVFAATDWLDGYLARKLNQTSSFGAFLDPVADKFLVCASLLVLVHLQRADVFVALIIIGREIAISALREWMAQIGASKSVAVHMIGKVKTSFQFGLMITLLVRDFPEGWPLVLNLLRALARFLAPLGSGIVVVLSVGSLVLYIRDIVRVLKTQGAKGAG